MIKFKIAFDNDEKGKKGLAKFINKLYESGIEYETGSFRLSVFVVFMADIDTFKTLMEGFKLTNDTIWIDIEEEDNE